MLIKADREKLGQLLLANTDSNNRLLIALIIRVEERELLQSILDLIETWNAKLNAEGENYIPPDAKI